MTVSTVQFSSKPQPTVVKSLPIKFSNQNNDEMMVAMQNYEDSIQPVEKAPTTSQSVPTMQYVDEYMRLNKEIHTIDRQSAVIRRSLPNGAAVMKSPLHEDMMKIHQELETTRRRSLTLTGSSNQILQKIDRQKRNENKLIHRLFSFNRQKKLSILQNRLSEDLAQAISVEEKFLELSQISQRMSEERLSDCMRSSDLSNQRELLRDEKKEVLHALLQSVSIPDDLRLMQDELQLANAEKKSCEAIRKQTHDVEIYYRQALQLLRRALAGMISPEYKKRSVGEFILGPYPMVIEAGRLIAIASMLIQPEARRKYPSFAPILASVRVPKFPNAIKDLARPGALAKRRKITCEMLDMLTNAENVVCEVQQMIAKHLEVLEGWMNLINEDFLNAEKSYNSLEVQFDKAADNFLSQLAPVV